MICVGPTDPEVLPLVCVNFIPGIFLLFLGLVEEAQNGFRQYFS